MRDQDIWARGRLHLVGAIGFLSRVVSMECSVCGIVTYLGKPPLRHIFPTRNEIHRVQSTRLLHQLGISRFEIRREDVGLAVEMVQVLILAATALLRTAQLRRHKTHFIQSFDLTSHGIDDVLTLLVLKLIRILVD
jgi:hypothetical protein